MLGFSEVSAPDLGINIAEARHRAVGLSKPQCLDAADRSEQAACHGVVRFNEHRERHPRGALVSCDLTQARHGRAPLVLMPERCAETSQVFRARQARRRAEHEAGFPRIAGPSGRPSGTHTRSASSTEKHVC